MSKPFQGLLLPQSLRQFTSSEFAKFILLESNPMGNASGFYPRQVVLRRLEFQDVTLKRVLVTGFDPNFTGISVILDSLDSGESKGIPGPVADREANDTIGDQDDDALHEDEKAQHSKEEGPLDLLSMVCEGATPSVKPSRSNKAKSKSNKMTSAQLRQKVIDEANHVETVENMEDCSKDKRELLEAVGDLSIIENLDEETASSILDAFRACKRHHQSESVSACTLEVQGNDDSTNDSNVDTQHEPQIYGPGEDGHVGDDLPTDPHPPQSANSKSRSRSSASKSRSISADAPVEKQETVLENRSDSTVLKLVHYQNLRFGNIPYAVRLYHPNGISTPVGQIHVMSTARNTSYKAVCSMHTRCQCWFYSLEGGNLDKVIQWISAGLDSTPQVHSKLSDELRESFGIRVRR